MCGLLLTITSACDKGAVLENLAPDTRIFLENIALTGPNRLNSVVQLYWSGEDRDGYVIGYEFSLDNSTWIFTENNDSTFRFDLPVGSDTVDINFYVRAIDNDDLRDPEPAYLRIPLKNLPPVARFDTVSVLPDTVFSAGTVLFSIEDSDGDETVQTVEIRMNDGPWYELPRSSTFISFLPENPTTAGAQGLRLFDGPTAVPLEGLLQGGVVGASNRLYVRAQDIAGSYSLIDSSKAFWLRQQQGSLLLVDDHSDAAADALHRDILQKVYPDFDVIDIRSSRPPIWDPTLSLILGVYDKVLWYSDGSDLPSLGQQLTLEVASASLQQFLNDGGKLFVSAKFPATFNDPSVSGLSTIFSFSPMDSLSSSPGQARIPIDSLVNPIGVIAGQLPPLVCGTFITGADPFYLKDPNNAILDAQLVRTGNWSGPTTIGGRSTFANGETNQVFIGVELHRLDGDRAALEAFLDWAMNDAFDW